jgi:hypothetical protein
MKTLAATFILLATLAIASDDKKTFEPVDAWPQTVTIGKVVYYNPPVSICVKAGYRLKTALPVTPVGKQVKSLTWEQDTNDASRCVAVCAYEDAPPPPPPEVLIEIPATNIVFWATSNGVPREWRLKSIAATNKVEK